MLNKSSESGLPGLVPDLRLKVFQVFPVEYNVSYRLVKYSYYYVDVHSLHFHFGESFHYERMMKFVKMPSSASTDDPSSSEHMICVFHYVYVMYYID